MSVIQLLPVNHSMTADSLQCSACSFPVHKKYGQALEMPGRIL